MTISEIEEEIVDTLNRLGYHNIDISNKVDDLNNHHYEISFGLIIPISQLPLILNIHFEDGILQEFGFECIGTIHEVRLINSAIDNIYDDLEAKREILTDSFLKM